MHTPRFGLALPTYGLHSDPGLMGDIAALAEESGWDGIFVYDTMLMPDTDDVPISDPWIDITVMAARTSSIRVGVLVVPLPRHRPWQISRMATTLDHLSGGRFILGVGPGDTHDRAFGAFGEPTDARSRARRLDEGLEIIRGLWSGDAFSLEGEAFTVDRARFRPTPVQSPRIPIWVALHWPARKPTARAARQDGAVTYLIDAAGNHAPDPGTVREIATEIHSLREDASRFDVVINHPLLHPDDRQRQSVRDVAEAGATWLVEYLPTVRDVEQLLDGIRQGPPAREAVPQGVSASDR